MLAVIILMAALVTAVIYPCFIVSSKWSRLEEKEQEPYRWCTDECLHCEQNDWCKFSEVKKEGTV